jgi:LacI family transcriptional regulator
VGYDNWDVMEQGRTPSLTTIDPELPLIGRRAGELLLAAIDGQPLRGTHVMAPHLVVRDSTTVNLRERPNGPAKSPTN